MLFCLVFDTSIIDTLYITLYIQTMNKIISVSNARATLPDLVNKVNINMNRITITVNGQPKATLISAEELESLEETAEVLNIPGAKESILAGLKQAKKGRGVAISDLK